jgi:CheY-like chemotaxis protein
MTKAILLVDDEMMIREVVQEKLGHLGRTFYQAGNGVEALAMLESHPDIGIVVSDIKMPIMDGVQLIGEARERGFEQPFIFFTAFASRETLNEVSRHGVYGFIEKGQMDGLEESIMAGLHEMSSDASDLKKMMDKLD